VQVNRRGLVAVVAFATLGATTGAAVAQTAPGVIDVRSGGKGRFDTVITDPGGPGGSTVGGAVKKTSGKTSGAGPPVVRFEDGSYSVGGDVGVGCFIERAPELDQPGPPVREAYRRSCDEGTLAAGTGQVIYRAPGSPPPVQVTPAQLAQRAASTLQLPDPQVDLSPSPDIVAYQLVNLPTWWAGENWAPQTQRTQLGPVWAEVTATPVSTRFDGGDGSAPVTCNRRGVKWRSGLPEELPQACRFTYQRANEQVTATISVTWRVTWVGSGGTGGTLPVQTTSSDQPLTVYERQAVVTSGRG
jgi:hypothetical protein